MVGGNADQAADEAGSPLRQPLCIDGALWHHIRKSSVPLGLAHGSVL